MPDVPAGSIAQVFSQPGTGTAGFALNANNYLTYNGNVEGEWSIYDPDNPVRGD